MHREEGLSIKQQKESTGNDRLKSFGGTNLCVSKDNYAGLSVFCARSNIVDVTEPFTFCVVESTVGII